MKGSKDTAQKRTRTDHFEKVRMAENRTEPSGFLLKNNRHFSNQT